MQKIQKRIEAGGQTLNIDDFIYQGGNVNNKLNTCFRTWKNFPSCRYVLRTVSDRIYYQIDDAELEQLDKERETGVPFSEPSNAILDELCGALMRKAEEAAGGALLRKLEKRYPIESIRANLLELREDFFLEFLAPLLDLSVDEINVFLVRVLKRDQLCNYVAKEYLLWLATVIGEKLRSVMTLEILYELQDCYESIPCEAQKRRISGEDGTRYISGQSDGVLKELEGSLREFRVKDYPGIYELLAWHKSLELPSGRERRTAFETLIQETVKLYHDEIYDYLRVLQTEEVKRSKLRHRESLTIPLTIWYRKAGEEEQARGTKIPAETLFIGKNCNYVIKQEVELPQEDYTQIYIHVRPVKENKEIKPLPKTKSLPTNAPLTPVAGNREKNGKPVIKNVRTDNIKNIDTGKDSKLWTKPKWLDDPKGTGFVVMDILAGEEIPEDLCLEYNGYRFVPTDGFGRKYELQTTVTAYLDVSTISKERAALNKKSRMYIFEETNSITRMRPEMETVLGVSNLGNRMTGPQDMFDEKFQLVTPSVPDSCEIEKRVEPWKLFADYMYSDTDYGIVSGLDIRMEKKIKLDMEVLDSQWLLDSAVEGDGQWFEGLPLYRQRSVLLVLLFLNYIKINYRTSISKRERFIRNFRVYAERKMESFRFDGLYLGYPTDCLLMYLLATCDAEDICDTLRVLYKETLRTKGTAGRNM